MEPCPRSTRLTLSRRDRFLVSYFWLVLKNVIGWGLILVALVAGPLVPGPGGIPLFLIGFALITFPGKRKLTARILRGRPIRFQKRRFALILLALALALATVALTGSRQRYGWPGEPQGTGALTVAAFFLVAAGTAWLFVNQGFRLLNLLLTRGIPNIRRRVRPALRRHHVRLLPPRWRRRLPHERGRGPKRLTDEILKLGKAG